MPHLSLPIAVQPNGHLAAHEDDAPKAVAQSLALLLDTRPGERRTVPGYGLVDRLFSRDGYQPAHIAAAASSWEERATPADVDAAIAAAAVEAAAQTVPVYPREETS